MPHGPSLCRSIHALVWGLITIVAPALSAQSVPLTRLERADVASEPFTSIGGLRELPDANVLVSDAMEVRLRLVDFRSGASRDLGRRGQGPGEFERPRGLYAGSADTTWLFDQRGRRLLAVLADGQVTDHVLQLRMVNGGFKPPRGVDLRGRYYLDLGGILTSQQAGSARAGRAEVLRVDAASDRVDTVATLSVPPMDLSLRAGPLPPYRPQDVWAADGNGRLAIVRHDPYRVEWVEDGAKVTGPPVDWRPVRIGRAEREAWLDRLGTGGGIVVTQNGQSRTMRPPRPEASALDWPAAMPPFEGPAWIDTDGHVWVRRNRPASEPRALYDVFDGAGRLARQVELPAGRRMVGLGRGTIYVVRIDDDGLQWLERFRLPAASRGLEE